MKILMIRAPYENWSENPGLRAQVIENVQRAVEDLKKPGGAIAMILPPGWAWEVVDVDEIIMGGPRVDRIVIGENHAEQEPDVAPAGSP